MGSNINTQWTYLYEFSIHVIMFVCCSRFIINLPVEEQSKIRLYFHIEQAHWFYLDHYCPDEQGLKTCGIKDFAAQNILSATLFQVSNPYMHCCYFLVLFLCICSLGIICYHVSRNVLMPYLLGFMYGLELSLTCYSLILCLNSENIWWKKMTSMNSGRSTSWMCQHMVGYCWTPA